MVEDWEYNLPGDHSTIIVPKGFVFNGASITRFLWTLLSPTGRLLIPVLVHDFVYCYDYLWALDSSGNAYKYKKGEGQRFRDMIFRKVSFEVHGMFMIGFLAWLALVFFGWLGWRKNRRKNTPDINPKYTFFPSNQLVLELWINAKRHWLYGYFESRWKIPKQ